MASRNCSPLSWYLFAYGVFFTNFQDARAILVGLKKDLRNDPEIITILQEKNQKPVTADEASRIAKDLGCLRSMGNVNC